MITAVRSTRTYFALTLCLKPIPICKMERQNIEFRAIMKFLNEKGANAKEIVRRMAAVYGESSP